MRRGCSTQLHNVSFYQTYCILLATQGSRSPRVGNYPLCVAMFAPGFQGSEKGIFKNGKQFLDIIIINHFHIIRNFLGAVVREDSSTIISGGVMVSTTDFGSVGKGSSPFPKTDI